MLPPPLRAACQGLLSRLNHYYVRYSRLFPYSFVSSQCRVKPPIRADASPTKIGVNRRSSAVPDQEKNGGASRIMAFWVLLSFRERRLSGKRPYGWHRLG